MTSPRRRGLIQGPPEGATAHALDYSDKSPRPLPIEIVLLGGRHRTVAEFDPLARGAGLTVVAAGQQRAYFAVECRPS